MNPETGIDTSEPALLQYLEQAPMPLTLIAMARRDSAFDTAYDHFLYDFVGHPFLGTFPDIRRHHPFVGERVYDQRLIQSYSPSGRLVHVRQASGIDSVDREKDFFVVSADLGSNTMTEWRIAKVGFTGAGDSLRADLILSDKPFDETTGAQDTPECLNPIERIAAQRQQLARLTIEQAKRPHITLTSQGCWFDDEPLAPIGELVRHVDDLYRRFGGMALLQTSQRPGAQPAIVAA